MKYLLDTCICIYYINRKDQQVVENLQKRDRTDIVVCSITKCELYAGSAASQTPIISCAKQDRFLNNFYSFSFDDAAAREYGKVQSDLRRRGMLINVPDMQIAAIALANNLIVVTNDTNDFRRIPDLKVEDWTQPQP
ncbi:MAG: type II toxin-antitoxin system VapC family toxin [Chloroflexi bacterium]|nr:type II toxin-antitoxin system VapC family toxin [Chloroflexota bacterium]